MYSRSSRSKFYTSIYPVSRISLPISAFAYPPVFPTPSLVSTPAFIPLTKPTIS